MPIEPVWQKKSIGLQLLKGEGDGMAHAANCHNVEQCRPHSLSVLAGR